MSTKIHKKVNPVAVTVFFILIAIDALVCFFFYPSWISIIIVAPIGLLVALLIAASIKIADQ